MREVIRVVFGFFLVAASFAAWSQSPNPPIGHADSVGPSGGSYVTGGWACDPDNYGAVLAIHFYLDGTYSTGTFVGGVGAYDYRGDLYGVCGGTAYHGYNFAIPAQYLTPGQHTLYAYALDSGGVGPNPLLGALTFNVSAPPANPPIGNADWAGPSGAGYATSGWSCDRDAYGDVLAIHFYLDGPYNSGTFIGAVGAYDYRGDLYNVCGGTTYHGYNFTIPQQYLTMAGTHTVYAYALDNAGTAGNPLLGALSFYVANGQTPNPPYGWLDSLGQSGNTFVAGGWTCDPDNWGVALQVRFYLDGPIGSGTYLGSTTASAVRNDVASSCGGVAAHGYNFTLPGVAPGPHSLYVYAVDNGNVTSAALPGSPANFTVPQPPRTDLLYGYYYGCADYAPEQAGHINMWFAVGDGCSNNVQVWWQKMAVELRAARAAGATSVVLAPWTYMVYDDVAGGPGKAAANARQQFESLVATGLLDGWSTIMIYPQDEPDQNGINNQKMTAAVQMLRSVVAGFPQLAPAKFGVIYNCKRDHGAPGLAAFDWIGCDNYDADCGALGQLTSNFPITSAQRYMVVPGGSSGDGSHQQDPGCFVSFAQSDSRVAAIVPFLWQSPPATRLTGIRDNGMRSTYCQAGRNVIGNPGAC